MSSIRSGLAYVMLICGGLAQSSARADEPCRVFDDIGDKYALGSIAIGTPQLAFMSRQEAEDCYEQSEIEGECAHVDEHGVIYDINLLDPLEESTVGQARLDDSESYRGPLIAGIELGDTIETVSRKLQRLPNDFPPWYFTDWSRDEFSHLMTDSCLRSSRGALWSYGFDFDHGRLVKVWATKEGYESSAW